MRSVFVCSCGKPVFSMTVILFTRRMHLHRDIRFFFINESCFVEDGVGWLNVSEYVIADSVKIGTYTPAEV